jgi:hypothetical protein
MSDDDAVAKAAADALIKQAMEQQATSLKAEEWKKMNDQKM